MQKKKTLIYLREYLITTNPIRSLKLFFSVANIHTAPPRVDARKDGGHGRGS